MEFSHYSVLLSECIDGLNIKPDGVYVDCTGGGGGHSSEIAKRLISGKLFTLDQDPDAISVLKERLLKFDTVNIIQSNFSQIDKVVDTPCDGILFDLGVSSYQLDNGDRGFSYKQDAPLDMRMSKSGLSAYDVVNTYEEADIARILFEYGEERFSRQIARNIVKSRNIAPVKTTSALADIIATSLPAAARRAKNPCKKSFQAIRIEVNKELSSLSEGLDNAFSVLKSGGRMCVISFHSLEDRLVKQRFASWCRGCTCPSEFPVCVCGNKPKARLVSRKPLLPTENELSENKRSKSAKLRILEKL